MILIEPVTHKVVVLGPTVPADPKIHPTGVNAHGGGGPSWFRLFGVAVPCRGQSNDVGRHWFNYFHENLNKCRRALSSEGTLWLHSLSVSGWPRPTVAPTKASPTTFVVRSAAGRGLPLLTKFQPENFLWLLACHSSNQTESNLPTGTSGGEPSRWQWIVAFIQPISDDPFFEGGFEWSF